LKKFNGFCIPTNTEPAITSPTNTATISFGSFDQTDSYVIVADGKVMVVLNYGDSFMLSKRVVLVSLAALVLPASTLADDLIKHIDASTPRDVQIKLAMSAAPQEVAEDATVYILGAKGYEVAKQGSNGFNCIVDRDYMAGGVAPECFDAEGSRTLLAATLKTEQMRAEGVTEDGIQKEIEAGYKSGLYKAPSKPGIVYMLSGNNYLYDPDAKIFRHIHGHLMFYAPYMTAQDLGYKSTPSMPYLGDPGKPFAMMIVVPASTGADAEEHKHH
jgi:hypothetical protein